LDKNENDKLNEIMLQCKSLKDTMHLVYNTNTDDIWRFSNYKTFMRKYNFLVKESSKYFKLTELFDFFDIDKVPSAFDTIAMQQKNMFEQVLANLTLLLTTIGNALGKKEKEIDSLRYFLQVNLRKAIFELPTKEIEVQNAIEQLLIGRGLNRGVDYDREKGRVKVSAKEVIPDFIFPFYNLALEVKLLNTKEKLGVLIDEINADIQSYCKKYSQVYFIIYDLGIIRDEIEFKNDLDNQSNIFLIIVKH